MTRFPGSNLPEPTLACNSNGIRVLEPSTQLFNFSLTALTSSLTGRGADLSTNGTWASSIRSSDTATLQELGGALPVLTAGAAAPLETDRFIHDSAIQRPSSARFTGKLTLSSSKLPTVRSCFSRSKVVLLNLTRWMDASKPDASAAFVAAAKLWPVKAN